MDWIGFQEGTLESFRVFSFFLKPAVLIFLKFPSKGPFDETAPNPLTPL